MTDGSPTLRRRRVLSTLAAAGVGGLAGCPSVSIDIGGDGEDGGGVDVSNGDNDGSDDADGGADDTDGDFTCTDVTSDYDRQDVGARPFIFDFDYPSPFGDLEYVEGPNAVIYQAEYPIADGAVDLEILQSTEPGTDVGEMPEGSSGGTTTTFNGEEVQFAGISDDSNLSWAGDLPYQVDGEREVFSTGFYLSVPGEGSIECGDALREAAEHVIDSFEVNTETTIG